MSTGADDAGRIKTLVRRRVSSTNDEARRLLERGDLHGPAVILAEVQTRGRGRSGRRWVSPPGGLWMTRVMLPKTPRSRWSLYSLLAGVAAARAVERTAGLRPWLKWPNDLMYADRKLGGILCEAVGEHMIIGVGINVCIQWPEGERIIDPEPVDLDSALGGLESGEGDLISRLAEELNCQIDRLDDLFTRDAAAVVNAWREYSDIQDRRVRITSPTESIEGVARDITDEGALLVELGSGEMRQFFAADVSLRLGGEDR